MEEEDVRGDRGLSVFRLRAVSRLTLVVRCTEIGYSVSTQVLGFRFGCGWCCVVGFLFGCCWFCVLLLCVSAWWNRGIADEVTMASYGRAVTGTAVMARSANEEKKKNHQAHRSEPFIKSSQGTALLQQFTLFSTFATSSTVTGFAKNLNQSTRRSAQLTVPAGPNTRSSVEKLSVNREEPKLGQE